MKTFLLSLRSEYFKTRNTLSFWGAILLPVLLCGLVFIGYIFKQDAILKKIGENPLPMMVWMQYVGMIMGVMGTLLLPMYLIFMTYSVNHIEHKAGTWKSLFSLPVPKPVIYFSKAFYTLVLVFVSLFLFVLLSVGFGLILGSIQPKFRFLDADLSEIINLLCKLYLKLYLASLGIIAIQFLFSLIWSDFLKPMGFGFLMLVAGLVIIRWDYSYLDPFVHPFKALTENKKGELVIMTKEAWVSLAYMVSFFVAGYFVVIKRSVK